MTTGFAEYIKKRLALFEKQHGLKFCVYVLLLFLVSIIASDKANIDLLFFWQKGHWPMLLLSAIPTALLLHTLSFLKLWGAFPMALWIIFIGVQVYILEVMSYRLSFGIISNMFETDAAEAGAFFTPSSILLLIGAFLFSLMYMCISRYLTKGSIKLSLVLWCTLLAGTLANVLFIPDKPSMRETALWPWNNIVEVSHLTGLYWFQERPLMKSLNNLPSAAGPDSTFDETLEELTVFFHFGETARADHWSLNGYTRATTPFAEEEYNKGNLVNFPYALSFGAGTRLSCVGMLTPAHASEPFPAYGPFFDLFLKHGFSLQAFRSNQKADDQVYDSSLITLTRIFRGHTKYDPGDAHQIIPYIREYLHKEQNPRRMIFYYGEGSHAPYLYSEEYARFLPDDMNPLNYGKTPAELINRYDNSIYATDQFIRKILEELYDKCAVYIYASDHGEYLGEYGFYSHGNNWMCHEETRHVPLFIWMSPAFQKARPELARQIKENAQRLKTVSHDNLFHTTLSLGGITSPVIDASLDLTSPHASPYQGKLPEDIPEDFVFDTLLKKLPD